MFELDARLGNDTLLVGDMALSRVLLMNDRQFPWVILVPRRPQIREIIELDTAEQQLLWAESGQVSVALRKLFSPHKLNVAALGNVVPQLHLHHIARFTDDCAWPNPVWGRQPAKPYSDQQAVSRIAALSSELPLLSTKD